MLPIVRILFFVVLSFSLHFLSLIFDLNHPVEPLNSQQVKVGYVSKSANSFIPEPKVAPQEIKGKSEIFRDNQLKNKDSKTGGQHASQKVLSPTISKPVIPVAKTRKAPSPVKSTQVSTASHSSEISYKDNETIHEEKIEVEDLEKQLSVTNPVETELSGKSEQLKGIAMQQLIAKDVDSEPFGEKPKLDFVDVNHEEGTNKQSSSPGLVEKIKQNSVTQAALPRYAENTPPEYPKIAKLRGWEGEAVFQVSVLKNGRVDELKMSTSSGFRSLDNAARKALRRWKFWPATSFGIPIDSQVIIPVTFTLNPDNSRH